MRLQAEAPLGMGKTVGQRQAGVLVQAGTVHGLQVEMREVQMREFIGRRTVLRVDELELLPAFLDQRRPGLGTDADPVDPRRGRQGTIGLDRDFEPGAVQSIDQRPVELQERLAARADHERERRAGRRLRVPDRPHPVSQGRGIAESATTRPVRPDEIGITEPADCHCPVARQPGPQIAPGKATEHGGPARIRPFALERVVDFLDFVIDIFLDVQTPKYS